MGISAKYLQVELLHARTLILCQTFDLHSFLTPAYPVEECTRNISFVLICVRQKLLGVVFSTTSQGHHSSL